MRPHCPLLEPNPDSHCAGMFLNDPPLPASIFRSKIARHSFIHSFNIRVSTCLFAQSLQLCLTVHPLDRIPPVSSVHGILQGKVLEWVAMPSSSLSSQPRDQTRFSYISCIGMQVLYHQYHLGNPHGVSAMC